MYGLLGSFWTSQFSSLSFLVYKGSLIFKWIILYLEPCSKELVNLHGKDYFFSFSKHIRILWLRHLVLKNGDTQVDSGIRISVNINTGKWKKKKDLRKGKSPSISSAWPSFFFLITFLLFFIDSLLSHPVGFLIVSTSTWTKLPFLRVNIIF